MEENRDSFDSMERALIKDDGQAAASHLRAGHPIYYCREEYPEEIIREWPSGVLELVTVNENGEIVNVRPLDGE